MDHYSFMGVRLGGVTGLSGAVHVKKHVRMAHSGGQGRWLFLGG